MEIKIRHSLAYWFADDGFQRTGFRAQTVDVPTKEAKRLLASGAAVMPDDELPMVGRITPIPNTASDEELIAWVSVATNSEIAQAIAENPALGDRLLAARDTVKKRMKEQDDLLSGLGSVVDKGLELAEQRNSVPGEVDDEVDDEEDDLDADDPRKVVQGNVNEVGIWLSKHPDKAADILEAEKARALDQQNEVRNGVVVAVTAAANVANQ